MESRNIPQTADSEMDFVYIFIVLKSVGLFYSLWVFAFGCILCLCQVIRECSFKVCITCWLREVRKTSFPILVPWLWPYTKLKYIRILFVPQIWSFLLTLKYQEFLCKRAIKLSFKTKQNPEKPSLLA